MVHVVMYWYYFQAARGIRIWWKEWITRLQITQFVLDLGKVPCTWVAKFDRSGSRSIPGFVYYATYNYAASVYFPHFPHVGKCGGEEFAAFTGCATLSSYLVLFISFYAATYKKASKKQKRSMSSVTSDMPRHAALDLKNTKVPMMAETSETASDALHAAEGLMKAAGTQIVATTHDLSFSSGKQQ